VSVAEVAPAISDRQVLKMAETEGRILITFDSDYGELVYFQGVPCPTGIIYLRFVPSNPLEPAEQVDQLLTQSGLEIIGGFFVLDRSVIRRRKLPEREG